MKRPWILPSLLLFFLAAAAQDEANVDHYKEGQRLFAEKNFTAALEEFQKSDELVPDEPQIYSWIVASLNELGRHAEAKERMERAFELLREAQRAAAEAGEPVPPIDIGYYTLLARVQLNLGEFTEAVETLGSYPFEDDGSEASAKVKQALEAARQILKGKLVTAGTECLGEGDLECARTAFTQADALSPATPSVRESIAREALTRADGAPATTDEDKAQKIELYAAAATAARLWLEGAPDSAEAQRVMAKALMGTKKKEAYEEAIPILTSLWGSSADKARDSSIQLDLAIAFAGLEQWDLVSGAASTFIELNPEDPLGQGYCLRSFGLYQLGRCPEAIEDGEHCKNADGTPRLLKYVDTCKQRLTRQEADKAVAKEATLVRKCDYLHDRIRWARNSVDGIAFEELLKVIGDVKASEAECRSYLEAAERKESGNAFSSPTATLCAAGAKTASVPFNLATRSKEDLESLRAQTKKLLSLCKSSLDATQTGAAEGGLRKVEQEIERRR